MSEKDKKNCYECSETHLNCLKHPMTEFEIEQFYEDMRE